MRNRWKVGGVAAAVLLAAPMASAHQLACEKTVNEETYFVVDEYPARLDYSLKVINTHPNAPSEVLVASDPLLEKLGFEGFDVPFTLPLGDSEIETFSVTVRSYAECLLLARKDGRADEYIENTFTVRWDSGTDVCEATVKCERPEQEEKAGRMTGGGSVFGRGRTRVTHGFQIRCDADDPRQNLEVNWGRKPENNFHLLDMTSATCIDDPALDEENPEAGFDTYIGEGTGRLNGQPATIRFTFTDNGEPGKTDRARIEITQGGTVVLLVDGTLQFGNHQAHPAKP